MLKLSLASALAFLAAPAAGDVVTQRFVAASVVPSGAGVTVTFDFSLLPKGARVLRATFRPFAKIGGVPLDEPVVIQAIGDEAPTVTGKPLELAPPRFVTFDATEVVKQWLSGKLANRGLLIRGLAADSRRACLDLAFDGTPKDPPPPVTGLKAFYRAGQVFLTWHEVNYPFAGPDEVKWKDLKADLDRIRDGNGPVTTYRICRHTRPITRATIAEAELLDEVGQHSAFDEREIKTEWKGEQIKNVRVGDAPVPRTAVEEKTMLPIGTGVWATTCRKDGDFHYAVVATVDGVENTVALDAGNTAGPLHEKVAPSEPIFLREQPLQYQKRPQHCYVWWLDPPLSGLPAFVHLSLSPPEKEPEGPRALFIYNWWWGSGWNRAAQYPTAEAVGFTIDQNCMQTRGVHDGYGTLKAWSQGQVRDTFVRQFRALLPWIQAKYNVDADRVFALSSGWAWHYPDLFAAVFECTTMNMKRSPAGNECKRYWGDPQKPGPTEWGVSAWEYWNAPEWIKSNPTVELPLITYAPRMHTGDFGILDKPPLYRALLDTKRAWSTVFGEGPLIGHKDPDWMFDLRRTDSVAAFGNCSLDDNPGIGFGGDPGGQMNAWLAFEPRTQVDSPGRWEMTLYLLSGDKRGRNAAPLDACTADVTPRRCRKFKASPGDKFTWTNTSLPDGKIVQNGTAIADPWGLVTAPKVVISKGRNRLVIQRAR